MHTYIQFEKMDTFIPNSLHFTNAYDFEVPILMQIYVKQVSLHCLQCFSFQIDLKDIFKCALISQRCEIHLRIYRDSLLLVKTSKC